MKKYLIYLLVISMIATILPCIPTMAAEAAVIPQTVAVAEESDILLTMGMDDTCVNITWASASDDEEYVRWAKTDELTDGAMPSDCESVAATKTSSVRGYTARAEVIGLYSDTDYSYCVGSDATGWSQVYSFTTGKGDRAFSFLLAGDPQIGASDVAGDTQRWNATLDNAKNWFGSDVEFLMTAGDQVNNHSTLTQYDGFSDNEFFRSHRLLTTVGNHDNGAGYSAHFSYLNVDDTTLTNAGEYGGDYWIEYDGTLIMSLNFNQTSVAIHKAFMEKAIEEYKSWYGEPNWTIATFHQPIYSAGPRAQDDFTVTQRNTLAPVFTELGVDVVLTGHDHVYTRAYMMNSIEVLDDAALYNEVKGDAYGSITDPTEGMVFYLTANSSSGSKYYSLYSGEVPFAAVSNQESVPNITKVDVTPNAISFTTYRSGADNEIGDVMDFFAIHRSTAQDSYAPALNVPSERYIYTDEGFDPLDGITAYDDVDGDITDRITWTGDIDLAAAFTLNYQVSDAAGNITEKSCTFIPNAKLEIADPDTTVWTYLDDGTTPFGESDDRISWTLSDFDDSSWKEGKSAFGAKKGKIAAIGGYTPVTLLNQYYPTDHANAGENIPNFFMRTTFDLAHPQLVRTLNASIRYDDGCYVYINGVKVGDFNTSKVVDGVGYNNKISSNAQQGLIDITDPEVIASLGLREKGNVIAVQLFQANSTSSDVIFHLESMNVGITDRTPVVTAEGVRVNIDRLYGIKDLFIAKGDHQSYSEVKKNGYIVSATAKKVTADYDYTYTVYEPGVHTVIVRYSDPYISDKVLKVDIKVTEPVFTENGLQITVSNLDNVKVIRTAYGTWNTVKELKATDTLRNFSAKTAIKGKDPYTIQYRTEGAVTVIVEYNDGYQKVYHYNVQKHVPTVTTEGSTVTFGELEGLQVLRYAKGEYSTSSQIKAAQGSVALKSSAIKDGYITLDLDAGVYTFCVQYTDESYNYYTITIE